jgi:HAE1 family hydrophobic/amphiphilic exporter-1
MGGMAGKFLSAFGFTCAGAVVISLLVSFTLTPMLCSRFVRPPTENSGRKSKDSRFFRILDEVYTKALVWSMGHRKTIVVGCLLVVLSIVPMFMMIGKNMIPRDDQSQFNISIRLPEGSSLAATTKYSEGIARIVRNLEGVTHTLTTIGGSSSGAQNESSIYVKMVDIKDREISSEDMATKVRGMLKDHPSHIFLSVVAATGMGGGGAGMSDIQYYLQGPDLKKLGEYSDKIVAEAKKLPGVGDVDSSLRTGKPEVRLDIDRSKAADLGVSVQDIQQALNTLVAGQTASTFNAGDDQYDVVVRAENTYRGSMDGLDKMTVASTKNGSVGLNEVVRSSMTSGPSSVKRLNRQRIVELSGNLMPGGSQSAAVTAFDRMIENLNLGPDYKGGATGMTGEMNKIFINFAIAFALAFIFMYIALAAQFESFIHPVTILITLPLAIPFGLFSMLVMDQSINIFSGLGLLLLFGIVKKNAILQIDHTNGLRAAGMGRYDAIIQANRDRLRPILMTTLALVFGMVPLLLSRGAGSTTNHSIGVMVAGGQSLCLVLTLLAVPVFYSLWEDMGAKLRSIHVSRRGVKQVTKAAAAALVIVIAVSVTFAQTPEQAFSLQPLQDVKLPPRIGIQGEASIGLKDVIERVLAGDPELDISRISLEQAARNANGAEGYYSPVFTIDGSKSRTITPMASVIGGSSSGKLTSTDFTLTPTITGNSPWLGTTYTLKFSDSKQTNDSSFTTLNPQYPSSLSLTFTQPLLRDLRIDAGRRSLLVARKNQSLSIEKLRQKAIERVTLAVQYYWELVYAWQNLDVQNEAVQLAAQQYESNRRQVEQGMLAPIEVVAAQTQVATYRQTQAAARQTLTMAENNLKQMMAGGPNDAIWDQALIPQTEPALDFAAPTLKEAVDRALSSRPELAESLINLAINKIDTKYFKDQARPQIDFYATLTASGLAGTQQNAIQFGNYTSSVPEILIGSNGQSLSNMWGRDFPTIKAGIQVSLPFWNRTARENATVSMLEGKRLQVAKKQMELYVEADVRNALEQLNASRAKSDAAKIAARAAKEQYESEQRQFQSGTSTMFLVFQRQTSMIAARSSEVRARADLAEAIANVERATARTLESYQIKIK